MNWLDPLDKYCERVTPEFWAEPLNALSNLSFIVAAIFAWKLGRQMAINRLDYYWLVLLVFVIGVGSFLFHTFANLWSLFADILPIYIFQLSMIIFYGAAIARQKQRSVVAGSAMLLASFLLLSYLFSHFSRDLLNGSIIYLPVLIALVLLGVYQAKHSIYHKFTLLQAALLFLFALVFRSVDLEVCGQNALGTHFMWHLINGGVLYLIVKAYAGFIKAQVK